MASEIAKRKAQNKGVKHGTVRIGAKGKTVRRYNSKTGRWDVTKKDVKATGVALRPTKSSPRPTNPPSSLTKTKQQTTTNRAAVRQGVEGPKSSRTENYSKIGFRTPGSKRGIDRVTVNKPSDFPAQNGRKPKLQLVKQRNKDSRGRDVYRWGKIGNQ